MNNLSFYESVLNQSIGKRDMLLKNKEKYSDSSVALKKRLEAIDIAQALIQQVAQETQNQLVYHIEDVVNTALSTCFPDEYGFKLIFEIKRNKTEARLVFTKDGYEIDPMSSSGGGAVDVAAFALRIAAWSISSNDNVLIVDEAFRFLSRDLQPRAAEIMQEISKRLGVQIIQVSHSPDIIESSEKVFSVVLKKGVSQVSEEE